MTASASRRGAPIREEGRHAEESREADQAEPGRAARKADVDPRFAAYVADTGQPGLYAWARRSRVRFVFAYRPPAGGSRMRLKIDDYGAITLDQARAIAGDLRGLVAADVDPRVKRAEEERRALTVAQAVEGYLADLRERAETGTKRGKAERLRHRSQSPRSARAAEARLSSNPRREPDHVSELLR